MDHTTNEKYGPTPESLTAEQKRLIQAKIDQAIELLNEVQTMVYTADLANTIDDAVDNIQASWQAIDEEAWSQDD